MVSRTRWSWTFGWVLLCGVLLAPEAHAQFTGKRRAYATSFWGGTGASGQTISWGSLYVALPLDYGYNNANTAIVNLAGVGASAFRVQWLKRRNIDETVRDAHSLELETVAELGLVGVALLAALLGAVGVAGRAAHRADPALVAGPAAALTVWAIHSAIDWDWEMPALTLVAVVLAGALLATADGRDARH